MTLSQDLRGEIATAARDVLNPASVGGRLYPQDETLGTRGGGRGLRVYDDIERDCHAYAVLQKRKLAVAARPWKVAAAGDGGEDRAAAELVERQLQAIDFDRLSIELLDALLKGFAVAEVLWEVRGRETVAAEIRARDQRRFVFDAAGALHLLTQEQPSTGIPLPQRKFIVHRFGAKNGDPYGLGLGTRLFWPVHFKRKGLAHWLIYQEKFGIPTVLGRYPAGTPVEEQRKLLAAGTAISTDAAIVVPQGTELQFLEAARAGSAGAFENFARYLDEQISVVVLGETLSTSIGGVGSRAASETHNSVRLEIVQADADLLSETLNRSLVRWIVELNLPGARPPWVSRDVTPPEDLVAKASWHKTLVELGWQATPERIRTEFGPGFEPARPTPGQPAPPASAGLTAPPSDQDNPTP